MPLAKDPTQHNNDIVKIAENKTYWDNKADKDLSNISNSSFQQKANSAGVGSVVVDNTELVNLSINSDKLKTQNSFGSVTPYSPNRISFTGSATNTLSPVATVVTFKAGNLVQIGKTDLTFKNIDLDPTLELGFNFAPTTPTTLPSGVVAGTSILGSSVADNVDGTRATLTLKLTNNVCKVITTSNARDWVECTFTPALNTTWTYQPYDSITKQQVAMFG